MPAALPIHATAEMPSVHLPPRLVRDVSIDVMRGLALFIMIGADMGVMLLSPPGFTYRLYSTLAAPIFILIAGMTVGRAQLLMLQERNFYYYMKRCVFLLMIGAVVDIVAWNILPFITADMLYFIAVMLPLTYFAAKLGTRPLVGLIALILLLTPLMQHWLGYAAYPRHYTLKGSIEDYGISAPTGAVTHWLVDGWFPLFPWGGYMLIGLLLARKRWHEAGLCRFTSPRVWLWGVVLAGLGGLLMYYAPTTVLIRHGRAELFYPPTVGVVVFTLGATLLLFSLVDRTRHFVGWQILRCLGEAPLFMYIVHIVIIGRVFMPIFPRIDDDTFWIVYIWFSLWLISMGWVLRLAKRAWMDAGRGVRWLVGGRLLEV